MENEIGILEQGISGFHLTKVAPLEIQRRVVLVLGEIGLPSPHQIIDDPNPASSVHQQVHHVAADESRTAGDDGYGGRAHAAFNTFMYRTL